VKTARHTRVILFILAVLFSAALLAACDAPVPRIPVTHTFVPGGAFSTNFNDEDPRRQVRCTVIFEVIDEAAIAELTESTYIVRDAVLKVLGTLTMDELTINKDLDEIAGRLVEQVNEALGSHIDLIVGAYFTEFAIA